MNIALKFSRSLKTLLFATGAVLAATALAAGDDAVRAYDLPPDRAERTLKLFSQQSGRGVIVGAEIVRTVRTNAVKGKLKASEALAKMLAGTGLIAAQDGPSGAFAVRLEHHAQKSAPPAPPTAGERHLK